MRTTKKGASRRGLARRRLRKAQKDFEEMMRRIAPFVKRKRTKTATTDGQWCSSTECLALDE